MVGIELQVARGIVAFLGDHQIVGLTTFAVNLLVSIGIAAGTDYGIFFFGRYQEARQAGEDRETAYYTTYRGVAHVVLASGLTIAGALFCLSFTRLPIFPSPGRPLRGGHIGRGRGRAHAGSGSYCCRKPFRSVRPQAHDQGPWMAAGRHGDRSVARAHSRRDISSRAYRAIDAAGIQTQLQRPEVYPQRYPRQSGVCGRRATFSPVANDDARHPVGRGRSRYAQSGGFSGIEQTSQGRPRRSGNFQGAGHNSARREPRSSTRRYRLCSACKTPASCKIMQFPERPHERHAQAGRRAGANRST